MNEGKYIVIEDNSYCYNLKDQKVCLAQPDENFPEYVGPDKDELGATYKIIADLGIMHYWCIDDIHHGYPSYLVESTKTGNHYRVGVCWNNPNIY